MIKKTCACLNILPPDSFSAFSFSSFSLSSSSYIRCLALFSSSIMSAREGFLFISFSGCTVGVLDLKRPCEKSGNISCYQTKINSNDQAKRSTGAMESANSRVTGCSIASGNSVDENQERRNLYSLVCWPSFPDLFYISALGVASLSPPRPGLHLKWTPVTLENNISCFLQGDHYLQFLPALLHFVVICDTFLALTQGVWRERVQHQSQEEIKNLERSTVTTE